MKLIGKGAFTKAYLLDDQVTVLLKSSCPIKECMACGWFPNSRLFPVLSHTDSCEEYTVKYYHKVTSLKTTLNPKDYKFYQMLRKLDVPFSTNIYNSYDNLYKAFESISDEWEQERQDLSDALEACSNYGSDIGFEISPRNVAVDNGNLILLDCFFHKSTLQKIRSNKAA